MPFVAPLPEVAIAATNRKIPHSPNTPASHDAPASLDAPDSPGATDPAAAAKTAVAVVNNRSQATVSFGDEKCALKHVAAYQTKERGDDTTML